ncbi:uncharacterized protein TNCV_7921 [Trichonephila clavipes]|nr:uncharacterized protein TNCV_7921 [Trichonephila clavipes]
MKTVTYRPQANLTERVNRNLVQMIACFVKENHENWDRFLDEFAFALHTSENETINKTPAELFLGRKVITHFSKLINVTEGAEYVGRNIEKLFDETRRNRRKPHKHWEKYYNRKRRRVNIKVNDLVLVQTRFICAAGRRVVGKFMPKFEGQYRVLEVRNNNLIILKRDSRKDKSPTVASRPEGSGQYNKARVTKTTNDGTNRAAERRTVRSKQTTAEKPCPYYLRSRVRQPEGFPEERSNSGLASIPQNNIRRRSLSMEALDGDQVDRSE